MIKEKPKYVYIAGINLGGLWSKKPLKAKLHNEFETDVWWYRGNLSVKKLGLDKKLYGLTTFASTSEKEVQIWIDGVLSVFGQLNKWIR